MYVDREQIASKCICCIINFFFIFIFCLKELKCGIESKVEATKTQHALLMRVKRNSFRCGDKEDREQQKWVKTRLS
ncbi:hypothetical protein RB195_017520 [Necator americanus]|uniref:Uncharacterized protein n=1 Tax=Necator americanus TaxID=51031 RepID=A0ABR1C5M2_NECAM